MSHEVPILGCTQYPFIKNLFIQEYFNIQKQQLNVYTMIQNMNANNG